MGLLYKHSQCSVQEKKIMKILLIVALAVAAVVAEPEAEAEAAADAWYGYYGYGRPYYHYGYYKPYPYKTEWVDGYGYAISPKVKREAMAITVLVTDTMVEPDAAMGTVPLCLVL